MEGTSQGGETVTASAEVYIETNVHSSIQTTIVDYWDDKIEIKTDDTPQTIRKVQCQKKIKKLKHKYIQKLQRKEKENKSLTNQPQKKYALEE